MNFQELGVAVQAAGTAGTLGLLIWLVRALTNSTYYTREVVDELRRDRDDWKEIALSSAGAAEKAVDLAERRRKDGRRGTSSGAA